MKDDYEPERQKAPPHSIRPGALLKDWCKTLVDRTDAPGLLACRIASDSQWPRYALTINSMVRHVRRTYGDTYEAALMALWQEFLHTHFVRPAQYQGRDYRQNVQIVRERLARLTQDD
jgi:hypothetical protein